MQIRLTWGNLPLLMSKHHTDMFDMARRACPLFVTSKILLFKNLVYCVFRIHILMKPLTPTRRITGTGFAGVRVRVALEILQGYLCHALVSSTSSGWSVEIRVTSVSPRSNLLQRVLVVFESPVQSSLLTPRDLNRNCNQSIDILGPQKTRLDRCRPVFSSLDWFFDWSQSLIGFNQS
jgi:hypothetical protein